MVFLKKNRVDGWVSAREKCPPPPGPLSEPMVPPHRGWAQLGLPTSCVARPTARLCHCPAADGPLDGRGALPARHPPVGACESPDGATCSNMALVLRIIVRVLTVVNSFFFAERIFKKLYSLLVFIINNISLNKPTRKYSLLLADQNGNCRAPHRSPMSKGETPIAIRVCKKPVPSAFGFLPVAITKVFCHRPYRLVQGAAHPMPAENLVPRCASFSLLPSQDQATPPPRGE